MTIPAAPKALKSVVKKNRGVMFKSHVNSINLYVININIGVRLCPLTVYVDNDHHLSLIHLLREDDFETLCDLAQRQALWWLERSPRSDR